MIEQLRRTILVLLTIGMGGLLAGASAQGEKAEDFVLREQLGYGWMNECVSFPLNANQLAAARQGRALVGEGGQEVSYQLVEENGTARISFQVDLPAYQTLSCSFTGDATRPRTDLGITESAESIIIENARIGIEIRKRLQPGQGPIAAIRLRSGTWTGGSILEGGPAVQAYKALVIRRGPVFAEVMCRASYGDQGEWTLRFRIERGEPVVRVEESFDVVAGGVFRVMLGNKAFQPTNMLYRSNGNVANPYVTTGPIASFALEPWIRWQNEGRGNWLALYTPAPQAPGLATDSDRLPTEPLDSLDNTTTLGNQIDLPDEVVAKPKPPPDTNPDLLMVGVLRPSVWVNPEWKGKAPQPGGAVGASVRDGIETLAFPLAGGRRIWMLGTPDKAASVAVLAEKNKCVAPLPQQYLIKHGDFPLDEVKDYVLSWRGDHVNYPRLFVHKKDLPAVREEMIPDQERIEFWISNPALIDKYSVGSSIREYLASDDERLGKALLAKGKDWLQYVSIASFLEQNHRHALGVAPHMQALMFMPTINALDAVLGSDFVTAEERRRILARIAFIGYAVNRDDYWSPSRGFSGFPNMTTAVAIFQTAIACMIPSHPKAKEWADHGVNELHYELLNWSDEDGGWLEAPHYAMVSLDCILGGMIMATNAGFGEYMHEERVRKVAEWFAKISTPRNPRTAGFRHLPPLGNTYWGETTAIFGIIGGLWRDIDPEFAANMQWMHEEQGSPGGLGLGWSFPTMIGYTQAMIALGVKAKAPKYGSAWFRKTGVVLRNNMTADRETYLHLIAGPHQSHYDYDSGSIILWGKGAMISDDWGYIGKHGGEFHSLVGGGGGSMNIQDFATTPAFDYVCGRDGAWQRQIAFAKDPNPLGPTFFVLRDSQDADAATSWRLWLKAKAIETNANGAMVAIEDSTVDNQNDAPQNEVDLLSKGDNFVVEEEEVDASPNRVMLDIFFNRPDRVKLTTSAREFNVGPANLNGREGRVTLKQTCLQTNLLGRSIQTALLYPRLKKEPSPTVKWHADGHIAQVDSTWGTDYVFMATKPRRTTEVDGKTLLPLFKTERIAGKPGNLTRKPVDCDLPQMVENHSGEDIVNSTYKIPAHFVALHPAEKNPVTAVWQSPVKGTVKVMVQLKDGDAGGSDGIAFELRQGAKVLAKGVLENGGTPVFVSEMTTVEKGELIRLVILPRESNWWDTTLTEMLVRETGGQQWNLREAVMAGEKLGNDPGGDPAQAVWWICEGDAEKFDPRVQRPVVEEYSTADRRISFQGTAGAVRVRGNTVTLTLGAEGKIRFGNKVLEADAATSRTETR